MTRGRFKLYEMTIDTIVCKDYSIFVINKTFVTVVKAENAETFEIVLIGGISCVY
jgi:hypothetical protein